MEAYDARQTSFHAFHVADVSRSLARHASHHLVAFACPGKLKSEENRQLPAHKESPKIFKRTHGSGKCWCGFKHTPLGNRSTATSSCDTRWSACICCIIRVCHTRYKKSAKAMYTRPTIDSVERESARDTYCRRTWCMLHGKELELVARAQLLIPWYPRKICSVLFDAVHS